MPLMSAMDDTLGADRRRIAVEAEVLDLLLGVILAELSHHARVLERAIHRRRVVIGHLGLPRPHGASGLATCASEGGTTSRSTVGSPAEVGVAAIHHLLVWLVLLLVHLALSIVFLDLSLQLKKGDSAVWVQDGRTLTELADHSL